MNARNALILLIVLCLAQPACKDFSQVVEIDIPEHEPRLATNLIANSQDSSFRVLVSNSLGILENRDTVALKDARVELFRNGELLETGEYLPGTYHYILDRSEPLGPSPATYRLSIAAPGFPSISSEQKMPEPIDILSAGIELDGALDSEGARVDKVTLEFQDAPQSEDFYALALVGLTRINEFEDSLYTAGNFPLKSTDPSFVTTFESSDFYLMFSDAAFDGQKARINVFTYQYLKEFSGTLRLFHLTRDTYLYYRSLKLYEEARDNPFAEPVIVHTNVENGYGIFGLSSVTDFPLEE